MYLRLYIMSTFAATIEPDDQAQPLQQPAQTRTEEGGIVCTARMRLHRPVC